MKNDRNTSQNGENPENRTDFQDLLTRANGNDLQAQHELALCYYAGDGTNQNYEYAAHWFTRAANMGHIIAQYHLGVCYENGFGVEQDLRHAAELYRAGGKNGDTEARENLCRMAESGFVFAQLQMGRALYHGHTEEEDKQQENAQAALWFQRAAEQGDAEAQYLLGRLHYETGKEPDSLQTAVQWFEKSAAFGNLEAMCRLGEFYERGQGVPKDAAISAEWYRKAANSGSPYGLYKLAFFYEKGCGVEQDLEKAYALYCTAADWGSGDAEEALGRRFGHKPRWKILAEEHAEQKQNPRLMSNEEEYREYSRRLERYNWDDGFTFPQSLLNDSGCDLALALKIFYLADGYSYLHRFLGQEPVGSEQWLKFVEALYTRILENHFPDTESLFPGEKHSCALPLSKVQRFRLRKAGVPAVFLENL